jgi:hypothetical protein
MEGYHSQSDSRYSHHTQETASSSSHDHSFEPDSYQPSSYSQKLHSHKPQRTGSRSSSVARPDDTEQLLPNALNDASDRTDFSMAVDQDLIAQITAEVKKSVLAELRLNTEAPPHQYAPNSPTQSPNYFPPITSPQPRNTYTPPLLEEVDRSTHGSISTDPLVRDPVFDEPGDTLSRRSGGSVPTDIASEDLGIQSSSAPLLSLEEDYSPLEKVWQRLFDIRSQPTPRLGQFLRGLAVYLVRD